MFGLGKPSDAELFEAAMTGDTGKMREVLVRQPVLMSTCASKSLVKQMPSLAEGMTPLHVAAEGGHEAAVELLMSCKVDVNAIDVRAVSPLHLAAAHGHVRIIETLIDSMATVDARDLEGSTPLHLACLHGNRKAVACLLAHEADANANRPDGNRPIHLGARSGSKSIVSALLAADADPKALNHRGQTVIHQAIVGSDHSAVGQQQLERLNRTASMVALLISLGVDVNAVDQSGETALDLVTHFIGSKPNSPLVKVLRAAGGEWARYSNNRKIDRTLVDVEDDSGIQPEPATLTPTSLDMSPVGRTNSVGNVADHRGKAIKLGNHTRVVGRDSTCDIIYQSLTLSRRHAQIDPAGNGHTIKDLGSRNGVLIDGQRIKGEHYLSIGERVTLGLYEFEYDGKSLIPARDELSNDQLQHEKEIQQRLLAAHKPQ